MATSTLPRDGEPDSPPLPAVPMLARLSALEAIPEYRPFREQIGWEEMRAAIAEVREMLDAAPQPEDGNAGAADPLAGDTDNSIDAFFDELSRRLGL